MTSILLHVAPRRWTVRAVGLSSLITLGLLGCGGNSHHEDNSVEDNSVAPLPLGETDPHAVTEQFLARNPKAALRRGHLAILWLEPAGTYEGDTGAEEGVDAVPYFFDRPTPLRLQIHPSADQVQGLVLRDRHGHGIAVQMSGAAFTTLTVQPGIYLLEVHHRHKGDPNAPPQRVFLRPRSAEVMPAQAAGDPVATLEASQDCENCDFTYADLTGQHFDGLNLSGSRFTGATLDSATFTKALMNGCYLNTQLPLIPLSANETDFRGANLTGAHLEGMLTGAGDSVLFTGATLDQTAWGAVLDSETRVCGLPTAFQLHLTGDFRNVSAQSAKFAGPDLNGSDWRGANLAGADFTPPRGISGPHCQLARTLLQGANFSSPEPASGRATNLTNVVFANTDLTGADLSNAILSNTQAPGATLTGANLSAKRMRASGSLLPADIFNNQDLTGTDFSGFNFAGFDLSRADLSQAILSENTLGTLSSARLSDGTAHGVNLAGQVFPQGFGILQGQTLSYANLSGASLVQANLESAILTAVNFTGANLAGANLAGATVQGARFTGANLANVTGPFSPADIFNGQDLTGNNFAGFNFAGFDLSQADLSKAVLSGPTGVANLAGATLSDGTVHGVNLAGQTFPEGYSYLKGKDLRYANLSGVSLLGATLDGTKLDSASFTDATLSNASLQQITAGQTQFQGATLDYANLKGATLCQARFDKSPATGKSASLVGAYLQNANLVQANLDGAGLDDVNFYSSINTGTCAPADPNNPCAIPTTCASAVGASMNSTQFPNAYLNGVDMSDSTPQGANFSEALLVGVNFTNANLSNDPATGVATSFANAFLQGANFTTLSSIASANFTSAYVDLTSPQGACMVFLLDSNHTAFNGWHPPDTPVCVFYLYSQPTSLPQTGPDNTCPDGSRGPCSTTQWQSPQIPIGQAAQRAGTLPGCNFQSPPGWCPAIDFNW